MNRSGHSSRPRDEKQQEKKEGKKKKCPMFFGQKKNYLFLGNKILVLPKKNKNKTYPM